MRITKNQWQCALLAALTSAVGVGTSAAQSAGQTPQVVAVPYAAIQSIEGRENFIAYCAVCHGMDGRGGGAAAAAMKAPVPDLTMLAAGHKGTLDTAAVEYVIRGTAKMATPAHGATEMPIWGRVFAPQPADQPAASLRIKNLIRYIESIQRAK